MKVNFLNNNLIVFLNKNLSSNIDFSSDTSLEEYFRGLFLEISDIYNTELVGDYDVIIYSDDNYGIILDIKRIDNDYFDYYGSSVSLNIIVSKYKGFLYKLDSIPIFNELPNFICYSYKGSIYLDIKKIDFNDLGMLIEHSSIIYGKECWDIKNVANIVSNSKIIDNFI